MSTVVSVESVRGGDLRTRGLSASLGEYSPPWAHAVHVARASEKKGAPCSCGSWRGVRAWPVVSVLYLPENASEKIARCGVKNLPVLFSNSRVCVRSPGPRRSRSVCVCSCSPPARSRTRRPPPVPTAGIRATVDVLRRLGQPTSTTGDQEAHSSPEAYTITTAVTTGGEDG